MRGCTVVGKLPKWRYGLAVAEVMEKSPVGEKVLVIGGHQRDSGGELADVDVFDVNTKTFSRGTPLPAPRAGHVAASGYEFKHVIVAGGNQKSVDVWDVEKKAWKSIGALKTAPLYSMAVGQSIGTTFLAGGDLQYKGALSSGAYLVTPYAVTATTDLPSPRVATFATTTSKSGFAVLGGGPDLAYDEKAKQWKPLPADDGIAKIFKAPSYPKGERIYATYQQVATSDAVYQRSTGDEWVKVPTQKNHAGGAAVSLGGGMFVVGGINEDAASAELCTF